MTPTRPPSAGPIPPPPRRPNSGCSLHLDLSGDPTHRRVPTRELDARRLAYDAAAAVATDQVLGSKRGAVRKVTSTRSSSLHEPGDFPSAQDAHAELVDPARHDPFEITLQERQPVVVAGREVADVERDAGERLHLHREPLGQEPVRQCRVGRAPRSFGRGDRANVGFRGPVFGGVRPRRRQCPASVSSAASIMPAGPLPTITTWWSVVLAGGRSPGIRIPTCCVVAWERCWCRGRRGIGRVGGARWRGRPQAGARSQGVVRIGSWRTRCQPPPASSAQGVILRGCARREHSAVTRLERRSGQSVSSSNGWMMFTAPIPLSTAACMYCRSASRLCGVSDDRLPRRDRAFQGVAGRRVE